MKRLFLFALLAFGLLSAAAAQTKPVDIGYVLWDSEIASTHVLATVIQDELGYDVNLIAVDAGPMYSGLARGDLDVSISVGLPFVHGHYWEEFGPDIIDLGANLENTRVGLVAPSYVGVDSIADLNDYAAEFNGEIVGVEQGAGVMTASEEAIEAYDLGYNLIGSSDPAMIAALDRAIENEEWIVITGWDPHWMWNVYDLKYLEDPKGSYGDAGNLHTVISRDFAESAPEDLLAFLENFEWTALDMGEVMLAINQDGLEPWEAARNWVNDNQEKVQSWLQ